MSQDQWSPRADVVEIFVSVCIPDTRALAANDEWRITAHRAKCTHRRVDSARNHLFSALLKFARDLDFAGYDLPPSPRRVKYTRGGGPCLLAIFEYFIYRRASRERREPILFHSRRTQRAQR